jgi:hypothetical protein
MQVGTSMKVFIGFIVATLVYYTAQAEQPRMDLSISTNNDFYHPGEQILIDVKRCYHNLTRPLPYTMYNAGATAELDTKFSVKDQDGAPADKTDRNIHPYGNASLAFFDMSNNGCYSEMAELDQLFKIEAPNLYTIRATSAIPPELGGGVAESNEIKIEIEK